MSKSVVILKASPRPNGNSSVLARQVQAGAIEAGAEVASFNLHDLDIRPCDGCDVCLETGVCVVKDDMQKLYPLIQAADALVLASPIYWFTYNAQLKTCIDRWYALFNSDNAAFKGKKFGIVLSFGDSDVYTSGTINAIHTFETMCRYLKADIVGYVYGSMSDVGDAQKHTDLMDLAFLLGKELVG